MPDLKPKSFTPTLYANAGMPFLTVPAPKPYHPSSFAYATVAVAEDLERVAESLRQCFSAAAASGHGTLHAAIERLDHQAAALREIARKSYRDQWPTHVAVEAIEAEIDAADERIEAGFPLSRRDP